jgi:hypothetical protein
MLKKLGLTLALCAAAVPATASEIESLTRETREATQPLLGKVVATLKDTLATQSPHETVDVCRERLPGMVKETREKTGWNIRRVSLKARNAERGTPDAFEVAVLADFDRRAAAGEKRETLEVGEIVQTAEGRVFRYMKALPVQEVCMNCHGDAASLAPDLRNKLAALYPADKATGYSLGQIRGALTVQRKLP